MHGCLKQVQTTTTHLAVPHVDQLLPFHWQMKTVTEFQSRTWQTLHVKEIRWHPYLPGEKKKISASISWPGNKFSYFFSYILHNWSWENWDFNRLLLCWSYPKFSWNYHRICYEKVRRKYWLIKQLTYRWRWHPQRSVLSLGLKAPWPEP